MGVIDEVISQIMAEQLTLEEAVQQFLMTCPAAEVAAGLSALVDHHSHLSLSMIIETRARSSVCGAVFRPGDLVWTCDQCGKDGTCVLCYACFRLSDHEGHQVLAHSHILFYAVVINVSLER
jgi:hypothetical protein